MEIRAYKSNLDWFAKVNALALGVLLLGLLYEPLIYVAVTIFVLSSLVAAIIFIRSNMDNNSRETFTIQIDDQKVCAENNQINLSDICFISFKDDLLRIVTSNREYKYRLLPNQLETVIDLKAMLKDPEKFSYSAIKNGFDVRYEGTDMVIAVNKLDVIEPSRLKNAMENILDKVVINACKVKHNQSETVMTENYVDSVLDIIHNKRVTSDA